MTRIALALATLATAGLYNAAHATFPGENGAIVFSSAAGEGDPVMIQRVSPGNSAVTTLAYGVSPSVSPNGKKVAYLSNDNTTLYVMNIDGSNVVQLTNDQGLRSPAWLPDGSKVVFARLTPNEVLELWTINPDGSGKTFYRNLMSDAWSIGNVYLAWSPSGNSYTFNGNGDIKIADDVTPDIRSLMPKSEASSWAPDGRSILFNSWAQDGLFEISPDGSNFQVVTPADSGKAPSTFSPDGAFIAGTLYNDHMEQRKLVTRVRGPGTPTTFSWNLNVFKTDWGRVPKNCYASTPSTPLDGGGVLAGDVDFYASQCAIAVMPVAGGVNGVLQQAIAVGPDQRLYHRMLKAGGTPTWTGFTRVRGIGGSPFGIKAKKIAIAAAKDGSAQVVIINADNNLVYHAMRSATGAWSGFNLLNGAGAAPNFAARDVAIAIGGSTSTSPGNAQVIANGLVAGGLYHRMRWFDGSWTSFQPIADANTHNIALAVGEDGNANVLAATTAPDGSQGQIMQVLRYASGNWSGWGGFSVPSGTTISASTDIAVTRTLSGKAQVMFTDATGNAFFQQRDTPNDPSSWTNSVSSPLIVNTVGRAVSISAGVNGDSSSQLLLTRTYPQ